MIFLGLFSKILKNMLADKPEDNLVSQDAFNHDKGQKTALSGKFLHWISFPSLQVF